MAGMRPLGMGDLLRALVTLEVKTPEAAEKVAGMLGMGPKGEWACSCGTYNHIASSACTKCYGSRPELK